jgi:hypothetical protein
MADRQNNLESGLVIPSAQALITGTLVGAMVGSAATVWNKPEPLIWAVLAFTITTFLSWVGYRSEWRRALDVVLGVTLPAEPQPATEYPQELRIQITASDPSGAFAAGRWIDLPLPLELVTQAARRVEATGEFSHAALAGPGKPLSRSQFETLRAEFLTRGLAYWNSPSSHNQGVSLTAAGRATVRRLAAITHPNPEGGQRLQKI